MRMTRAQFDWLETLVSYGPELSHCDLMLFSGVSPCYWPQMRFLIDEGFIHHEPYRTYILTERGRLAWAIQSGINARIAGQRKAVAA